LSSAAFVVAVVYIPIYVQGVQGGNATNAGLTLLPMMLGSSVAAPLGSQLCVRVGYRPVLLVSGTVLTAALILLSTLTPSTPPLWLTVDMVLLGVGIGPSFSVVSMASMHPFDERQRGAASATLSFVRELGMTVSIAVYGSLQRNQFADGLRSLFGPGVGIGWDTGGSAPDPRAMLSPAARAHIPGPLLQRLTDLLTSSITHTFLWTLIPAVLALVFTLWFGREKWAGFRQSAAQAPSTTQAPSTAE
jgi:MFS family permease